jgi:hypothetical protein
MAGRHGIGARLVKPGTSFVDVVDVVAASSGPNTFRVQLPSGTVASGGVGSVTVGGTVGQVDNVTTSYGWVTGFTVSVILPSSGQKRVAVSSVVQPATNISFTTAPTVTIDGSGSTGSYGTYPDFRSGTTVREFVYAKTFANHLRVHYHHSIWANGAEHCRAIYEYGLSVPGVDMDGATLRSYSTTITPTAAMGGSPVTYTCDKTGGNGSTYFDSIKHAAGARWCRDFGTWQNYAQCVPIGWGGAADDGTWSYVQSSKIIPQWISGVSPGALDNTTLDAVLNLPFPTAVDNTTTGHATAATFPWAAAWDAPGTIGPFTATQGQPGPNPDIGLIPSYCYAALRHLGSGGWHTLLETCRLRQNYADLFNRSKATGVFHVNDEGSEYNLNATTGALQVGLRLFNPGSHEYFTQQLEPAHWGGMAWAGYATTGELIFLETQAGAETLNMLLAPFRVGSVSFSNPRGAQSTRHAFYMNRDRYLDAGQGDSTQPRHAYWAIRTTAQTLASLSDDDTKMAALLGWNQTKVKTTWEAAQQVNHDCFVTGVTSAARFPAGSYRTWWSPYNEATGLEDVWMRSILAEVLHHAYDLGVLKSDTGVPFFDWYLQGIVDCVNDDNFNWVYIIPNDAYVLTTDGTPATPPTTPAPNPAITPAQVYEATRHRRQVTFGAFDWPPSGASNPDSDTLGVGADTGWAGRWGIAIVAAVDRGISGATSAHTRFKALAQRQVGLDYFPDVFYARAPR